MPYSNDNPYASPNTVGDHPIGLADDEASRLVAIVEPHWIRTRFWARFVGICSIIFSILMSIGLLVMVTQPVPAMASQQAIYMISLYGAMSVGGLAFGVVLLRYAYRISKYFSQPLDTIFEKALTAQRNVWLVMGACSAVLVAIVILAMLV